MKYFFTILLTCSFMHLVNAQTYCEDFEGFAVGDPIAETSSEWTSWAASINPALNPPYSDDVAVDGTQANSSGGNNNSLYLTDATGNGGPQDVILPLGGVWNIGEFELSMQMYVTNGTGAYFNFQEEATAGVSWSMDCMLDNQGNMTFSTGGGATTFLTTNYPFDTWFEIKMEIDLTTNYWEVFINGSSQGSFSNPVNQIASLNLYPTASTDYWVDDVCYTYTPYVLSNLNGSTQSIAAIEGLAGQTKFPSVEVRNLGLTDINSFDLTVDYNGTQITENITAITLASLAFTTIDFTQSITLTGGSQNLTATISNVNGNSIDDDASDDASSINVVAVTPANGKLVIGEEGTGTWCGYCPRGTVAMEWMDQDYEGYFQGIAIHNGDPMTDNTYDTGMGTFMGPNGGYPSATVDRGPIINPSDFKIDFLQRVTVAPSATIVNGAELNGNILTVSLTATFDQAISSNWSMACVLIEDSVTGTTTGYSQSNYYNGGSNGPLVGPDGTDWTTLPGTVPFSIMVYDHVARAINPGWDGSTINSSINSGDNYNACFEFLIDGSWNLQKMKIVGMLIDANGAIDNGSSSTISDAINNGLNSVNCALSNVQETIIFDEPSKIALFPNPTSGNSSLGIHLENTTDVKIILRNITGQIVFAESYKNLYGTHTLPINTQHFESGIYALEIHTNNKTKQMKLVIQ